MPGKPPRSLDFFLLLLLFPARKPLLEEGGGKGAGGRGLGAAEGGGVLHVLAYTSVWGAAGEGGGSLDVGCTALKGRTGPFLAPLNHGSFSGRGGVAEL